jgi:hypothetical protein
LAGSSTEPRKFLALQLLEAFLGNTAAIASSAAAVSQQQAESEDGPDDVENGAEAAAAPSEVAAMEIDSDDNAEAKKAPLKGKAATKSVLPTLAPLPASFKLTCPIPAQYLQYVLSPRIVRLLVQSISGKGPLESIARHALSVIAAAAAQNATVALAIVSLLVC